MGGTRSTHINRLRVHAVKIFGKGFELDWFATSHNRESEKTLQVLAGAHMTAQGKKYRLLPPVLYPPGPEKKKDIFLNPAIATVSTLFYQVFTTWYANRTQVLKLLFFGPSSLQAGNENRPGPKAAGTKWEIREVTPGAIALAAIMVSISMVAVQSIRPY
jgi:hypothetical protein